MKQSIILLTLLLVIACAIPAMAKDSALPTNADKALLEENLLNGLASDNIGLKYSCVLMLGKMQSDRAVVPLISILNKSTDENLRVAAAWALCKIGNMQGVYAVKMAAKNDESTKVKETCAGFYENFSKLGKFSYAQPEAAIVE